MGKAQELQRLGQHHEIVGREMLALGELRQVGAALVGRRGQRVEQADELLDRRVGQAIGDVDRSRPRAPRLPPSRPGTVVRSV